MRVKVKSVSEINDILEAYDFSNNEHDNIVEHLKRGECPYCATPLSLVKGVMPQSPFVLQKSSCSIKEFKDKTFHTKNSCNVKDAHHLIIIENGTKSIFKQNSGNIPDTFTHDED
jgi:hypothetical protein